MLNIVQRSSLKEYFHDLKDMTIEEATEELSWAQSKIDEETSWAEALQAFIDADGVMPNELGN